MVYMRIPVLVLEKGGTISGSKKGKRINRYNVPGFDHPRMNVVGSEGDSGEGRLMC